jgi:hypothetical protein
MGPTEQPLPVDLLKHAAAMADSHVIVQSSPVSPSQVKHMARQLGVVEWRECPEPLHQSTQHIVHPFSPLLLTSQVERMAKQLGVAEGQVYTCETAAYFWLLHVLSRWEKFSADAAAQRTPGCVQQLFPFKASPVVILIGEMKGGHTG